MNLSLLLISAAGVVYSIAFFFHMKSFRSGHKHGHQLAVTLMRLGFLLNTFYLAAEAVRHDIFLPVVSFSGALVFFAWSIAFVYLVLMARVQSDSFGMILTPFLFLLIFLSLLIPHFQTGVFQFPKKPFFVIHVISVFFAYACFAVSFAAGLLYLIQNHELKTKKAGTFYHELPSLEELERLIYQPMIWGAFLLSLAITVGFLWSKVAYGKFWILDPKTIIASVSVIFYSSIVSLRKGSLLSGKRGAVLSLIAFVLILASFVGTRFIEGSHNYLQ